MKKYAIFILALTVGVAAGICLRHIPAAQVFSEKTYSVVVDAGHGALGECFKMGGCNRYFV